LRPANTPPPPSLPFCVFPHLCYSAFFPLFFSSFPFAPTPGPHLLLDLRLSLAFNFNTIRRSFRVYIYFSPTLLPAAFHYADLPPPSLHASFLGHLATIACLPFFFYRLEGPTPSRTYLSYPPPRNLVVVTLPRVGQVFAIFYARFSSFVQVRSPCIFGPGIHSLYSFPSHLDFTSLTFVLSDTYASSISTLLLVGPHRRLSIFLFLMQTKRARFSLILPLRTPPFKNKDHAAPPCCPLHIAPNRSPFYAAPIFRGQPAGLFVRSFFFWIPLALSSLYNPRFPPPSLSPPLIPPPFSTSRFMLHYSYTSRLGTSFFFFLPCYHL